MVKRTNNNSWKIKQAEWRGYVAKSLEDLDEKVEKLVNKVDIIDSRIWTMQIKVAGIGAISAILVTLVLKFVVGV